jgi:hypothetical protein
VHEVKHELGLACAARAVERVFAKELLCHPPVLRPQDGSGQGLHELRQIAARTQPDLRAFAAYQCRQIRKIIHR